MSEISGLFSRNVLERPHTDEELDHIIQDLHQQRREQAEHEFPVPPREGRIAEYRGRGQSVAVKALTQLRAKGVVARCSFSALEEQERRMCI